MFSGKKNSGPLIEDINEERRRSFRIEPSLKEPIDLSIASNTYRVKDIGAGGIAIYRRSKVRELETEGKYLFKMNLPIINEIISGIIRIVHISDKVYHCEFSDIDEELREKIHFFVLERQKEQLREKKKGLAQGFLQNFCRDELYNE